MITLIAAVFVMVLTLIAIFGIWWAIYTNRIPDGAEWNAVFLAAGVLVFLMLCVVLIGMAEKQYMSFVRWGY